MFSYNQNELEESLEDDKLEEEKCFAGNLFTGVLGCAPHPVVLGMID